MTNRERAEALAHELEFNTSDGELQSKSTRLILSALQTVRAEVFEEAIRLATEVDDDSGCHCGEASCILKKLRAKAKGGEE